MFTLPEANIAPKNDGFKVRHLLFRSIFRCYVSGTVIFPGVWLWLESMHGQLEETDEKVPGSDGFPCAPPTRRYPGKTPRTKAGYLTLRIQICPKNPGFPLYSYDLGMGLRQTINPTIFREGSGFLGLDMKKYENMAWQMHQLISNVFKQGKDTICCIVGYNFLIWYYLDSVWRL